VTEINTPPEASALASTPVHPELTEVVAATFADFGLHADIQRALDDQGYVTPTPIQVQAIPVVLGGRDVMGAAQTGTGKTAGFALPMIQLLLPLASASMSPARHPVRALILTPTRELADQVAENVAAYARHTALRSTVIFGGVDMKPQTAALRSGVEIVIATPGRLLDHVQQSNLNLGQTQILVLDEADRMLDMGFLPDLQRILNLLPKQRQSLMFSATFSNEIKKLAGTFLDDPVIIEVARRNATADNVTETLYEVQGEHKRAAVAHIVRERALRQVLVFTNTKIGASRVARELLREGIDAVAIHGDKTQQDRMKALEAFKKGEIAVLVATDVAARGLDIVELPCVINYDLPYNAEDYVHRIGRTGRAGASGDAISLMAPAEERFLVEIEKLIRHPVKRLQLEGFNPGRAEHGRRSQRDPRDSRDESESTPRSAGRVVPRTRAIAAPVVDEWFLKPYEPANPVERDSSSVNNKVPPATDLPVTSGKAYVSRPSDTARPVAALLGGLRKSA